MLLARPKEGERYFTPLVEAHGLYPPDKARTGGLLLAAPKEGELLSSG